MTKPSETVTVMAVDDHPPFLEAAQAVVEATPGFSWMGGANSAREALMAAEARAPDLALVDVNMPEMDGVELAARLRRKHPRTLVALISAQSPQQLPQLAGGSVEEDVLPKERLSPSWLRDFWEGHRMG